ncbi:rab-like protein 2B isoform X7 [Myotis daubentonii]|uniref:rab-like protein 2B isoform X7 n=1 Tax=Myotis daubentonii TaxID=98922 RepID=UPI0028732AC3|nr:rab-like protein 2B isoform X7 [Myotis daubentonii]
MEGRAQEIAPSPELSQGPMARDKANPCEVDQEKYDADDNVKIICLGDSAVGKSKLLGHGGPGAVPEYACLLLPQGPRLHHADIKVTQKSFNFARKFSLPLYFVSAADGTNVVKLFNDAIRLAVSYKQNSQDFMDEVLQELEAAPAGTCTAVDVSPQAGKHRARPHPKPCPQNIDLEQKEEELPDQEQCGSTKSLPPS